MIADFDARETTYDTFAVQSALSKARQQLEDPSAEESFGAWAEVLAFSLAGSEHGEKPWGTHFGPMGSGTDKSGKTFYFPDIGQATPVVLDHWKHRAAEVKAAVLAARYNDLVWDLSRVISNERPGIGYAHAAIDAYLAVADDADREIVESFDAAGRALTLAIQVNDAARRDTARGAILSLHKRALAENSMWWEAHDLLVGQAKSALTDDERDALFADIEDVLARVSDASNHKAFDPHAAESAANKLLDHYRRIGKGEEARRLHLIVAKTFEHFGSLADPMLASMVLQTSMDAYRQAGLPGDEARILKLIEDSNLKSVDQMARFEHRQEIPKEKVEEFIAAVIGKTKEEAFLGLAREFLTRAAGVETGVREMAQSSPLLAMVTQTKLDGDRIVAEIGSIDDDLTGRTVHHANQLMSIGTPWLGWAMEAAIERQEITASDFIAWINRAGLFKDGKLLSDGIEAWFADDHGKALHILVPQVEAGFRALCGRHGRPTTKAHPQMRQARMVITMGEILFHKETPTALGKLGEDLVLHMRALYADPRGFNLRNDLAHGVLSPESIHAGIVLWVVHSLVVIGAWLAPVTPDEQPTAEG